MDKASRTSGFGLRRISWVRIDLTGAAPRAEVAGVGQHRPVTRSIPLSMANELTAAGVPTYVRRPVEAPPAPDLVEVG